MWLDFVTETSFKNQAHLKDKMNISMYICLIIILLLIVLLLY